MRVKKNKIQLLIGTILFLAFFLFLPSSVQAKANVSLNQSILPVSFVYLDKGGKIKNIWSNVSEKDNLYVVKFFDIKGKMEVSANKNLMASYKKAALRNVEIEKEKKMFWKNDSLEFLSVDFIEKSGVMEEVRTLV